MSVDLTPRQKKLISLMPKVESGELTMKQAMLQAGYAESTADQQSTILGGLRSNTKMQEALRKAGFTEQFLAEGIVEGAGATSIGERGEHPDYRARGIFYKLGAELLDAFPNKVNINADVTIEDLIKQQEADSPATA
ncbi:MAG TPA: hypothetical protein VGN57_19080 [Pirellulaceae bacterium]|jgi:hypothetical protein|nr:hypothetical protein [Pirellulaceae bacterium]